MPEFSNYVEALDPVVGALDGTEMLAASKDGDAKSLTTQQIADLGGGGGTSIPFGTTTGTNTYTSATTPATAAYVNGMLVHIKIKDASTGASTLNLDSVGAKKIMISPTVQAGNGHLTDEQNYILSYDSALDGAAGAFIVVGKLIPDADATTKGIAKLYVDVAAQNTDGAPDQNAVFDALALKAPLASPALTGTMTINGESITPGLEPDDVTGTAIAFAVPQTYGSVASPETGNITLNSAGLIKGIVQLLLHNSAVAPTFGAEFAKIGGNYQSSQLNSIYFHAVSATRIEYTINQTS